MYQLLSHLCWLFAGKSLLVAGIIYRTGEPVPDALMKVLSVIVSAGMHFFPAMAGIVTLPF